jgi:hypothetical protein
LVEAGYITVANIGGKVVTPRRNLFVSMEK